MNAVDLKALIARMPDAPVGVVLEELARVDPVLWCMTYRRLRGQPLIFDNSKQLSEENLTAVAQKMDSVSYQQELQGRLLRHRPFIIQPMRDQHPHKVYEKARQIGISETSLNEVIHFLWTNPGTKWVITLPRDSQLRDFSTTRIAEAFSETPQMRGLLGVPNQVYAKRVGDSFMLLRSAWEAGLGEGIDADGVTLDEKDRMKEKIEVAFRESMKSSKFGWLREISTPTIPGAGIDAVFKESDQQVWLVRCKTCGLEQEIEYPDNIIVVKDIPAGTRELPEGCYAYLCRKTKCRGDLDRMRGRWVARKPDKKNIRGYHMPQSIAPWISATRLMQNKIDYRWQSLWVNYCNFPNTYVTTRNGAKLIPTMKVGDRVLSHDGTFSRITELLPRTFTGTRVDIKVGRHEEPLLSVTSGHPLQVVRYEDMKIAGGQPTWVTADQLRVGDWLTYPRVISKDREHTIDLLAYLDASTVAVDGDFLLCSDTRTGKARYNALRVPRYWYIGTEEAKFLGLFLAEGCVTGPSTVHHKAEVDLIDLSKRMFTTLGANVTEVDPGIYPSQASRNALVVTGVSKTLARVFTKLFGGVSRRKRVPRFVLDLPRAQRLAFIAGYFGGDGNLHKGVLSTSTCSAHIAYGMQALLSSVGIPAVVSRRNMKFRGEEFLHHRIRICGMWRTLLLNELRPFLSLKMEDQLRHGEQSSSGIHVDAERFYFHVGAVEKTEVTDTPVFNFEVERTHSYVTNGFVSHNCLAKPSSSEGVLLTDTDFDMASAGHQFITRRTKDWTDICVGIDWGFLNWVVVMARNVHNQRAYILNLGIFEDKHGDELAAVKAVESFIAPYAPDLIVADAGYGKDRNSYLLRKFSPRGEGRFYACFYNPSTKGSRTFVPQWSAPEQARVLVDRTMSIKGICRAIREREFGLPDLTNDRVQLFKAHFKALAPVMTEEDGEIYEEIKASGDDHYCHAAVYCWLAMDQITKRGNFSFSFEG